MSNNWKDKPTMNLPEFAKIMGISRSLAFKMAADGKIPVIRLGEKRLVVPTAAVVRILDEASGQ
jgi:excisionase family DNA binding protein